MLEKLAFLGMQKTRGKISMKSILLATTALVAFAGAAAADGHTSITSAATGTLGYNDTFNASDDNELGFYWEGNLSITATATLDNGLTAGAYYETTISEDNDASGGTETDYENSLTSSDFVLSLEAENGAIFFGDTGTAAEKYWKSAGDMEADGVTTGHDSMAIRGDVSFGTVQASVGYLINDAFDDDDAAGVSADINGDEDALVQLSFGAAIDFDAFFATVAYQEETDYFDGDGDFSGSEIFGISGGGTFAGATVTVAYAENTTADSTSTGIQVAYPFGPVTATAYFVAEEGSDLPDEDPNYGLTVAYSDGPIAVSLDYDNDQDAGDDVVGATGATKIGIDGSYDVGNGLSLFAGYYTQSNQDGSVDYEDEFYVAGQYDLGGGASILVSYAEGEDNEDDEIGANDYQEGTTVELSFSF
jgi:outer membrane protein OmpU